jgi:hypothetical protein
MTIASRFAHLACGLMLLASSSSPLLAQGTPLAAQRPAPQASASPTPSAEAYEINGFRSARFGMSVEDVRAAIRTDFALSGEAIQTAQNQIERTTLLVVNVPKLEPGPGAAQVTYIFGYASKKLIQVNVLWATSAATKEARAVSLIAGVTLAQYFGGFSWGQNKAVQGVPTGANSMLLFAGEDAGTAAVQVIADGVEFERQINGKSEPSPPATVSPSLRVSYIANKATPDVFRIERGRF